MRTSKVVVMSCAVLGLASIVASGVVANGAHAQGNFYFMVVVSLVLVLCYFTSLFASYVYAGSLGRNPSRWTVAAFLLPFAAPLALAFLNAAPSGGSSAPSQAKAPAATLALAYVEQAHQRVVGKPLSLGVQLVTNELLSGRPAVRNVSATPEAFCLGVFGYFALLSAVDPSKRILGVIKVNLATEADLYLNASFAPTGASAKEYLAAFGFTMTTRPSFDWDLAKIKPLVITGSGADLATCRGIARSNRASLVVVEYDGTQARAVQGCDTGGSFSPVHQGPMIS